MIVRSAVLKKCIHDRDKRLLAVCLVLTFLMLAMVVGLFAGAIYLDLHPRVPIVVMTNATVGRFSISPNGSRDDELVIESFMYFTMLSRNRYGIPFRYVRDQLVLEYKQQAVATVATQGMMQEPRSNASFVAVVNEQTTVVRGAEVVRALRYDFGVNRVVVLLSGTVHARFTASKAVSSAAVGIPVKCEIVIQPANLFVKFKCQEFIS